MFLSPPSLYIPHRPSQSTGVDSHPPSSLEPAVTYDHDWTPHNYTNVDFAKEDVQGRAKIKALAEAKSGMRSRRERQ